MLSISSAVARSIDRCSDWTGLDWTALDWTGLDWTGLDWTGLDCTSLHCNCTSLQCNALHGSLHCTALHCTSLHCTSLHCTALHCTSLHCTALIVIALHCNAMQCTQVLKSLSIYQLFLSYCPDSFSPFTNCPCHIVHFIRLILSGLPIIVRFIYCLSYIVRFVLSVYQLYVSYCPFHIVVPYCPFHIVWIVRFILAFSNWPNMPFQTDRFIPTVSNWPFHINRSILVASDFSLLSHRLYQLMFCLIENCTSDFATLSTVK